MCTFVNLSEHSFALYNKIKSLISLTYIEVMLINPIIIK